MKNTLFEISIKNEIFYVAVADTEETRYKGLSGLAKLGTHKGMLFVFPTAEKMQMVMRDMNFSLDFLFLNEAWEIIDMGSLAQDSKGYISPDVPCNLVLELPKGTIERLQLKANDVIKPEIPLMSLTNAIKKFKDGGRFEIIGEKEYKIKEDDIKAEPGKLQILNQHGEVVANIEHGSRIFSRPHTKELIKRFKKGDKIGLAELMVNILDIQDNQEPDYVKK